jgi:hypothetical protein
MQGIGISIATANSLISFPSQIPEPCSENP